jgi:chromosome segregation ATPase
MRTSEAKLIEFINTADEKIARGDARLQALTADLTTRREAVAQLTTLLGQRLAAAALDDAPFDAREIRAEIDQARRAIAEGEVEQRALEGDLADLRRLAAPKRAELQRIRAQRAAEAGGRYGDSLINDVVAQLPAVAAAQCILQGGSPTSASPEKVVQYLAKLITDRRQFSREVGQAYEAMKAALKL